MEFVLGMVIIAMAGLTSVSQVFIARTFADYLREKAVLEQQFYTELLRKIS